MARNVEIEITLSFFAFTETQLFWANVKIHAAVKYNTPWCYGERCLHLYEMIIFDQIMFTILALKSLRKCVANVLRSSGVSWKSGALIVRHSQKKECISFVLYCFEKPSIAIPLEELVWFLWGFLQNVPLQMSTSIN